MSSTIILIGIPAILVGIWICLFWRIRRLTRLNAELAELKENFNELELQHSNLSHYTNSVLAKYEVAREKIKTSSQIIRSLKLNLEQLEQDRQNIINAFNTYKNQTVDPLNKELEEFRNSNQLWINRYNELLQESEEKNALVIDLARYRDSIKDQFLNYQNKVTSAVNGKRTVDNLRAAYDQLKMDFESQRKLLEHFQEKYQEQKATVTPDQP